MEIIRTREKGYEGTKIGKGGEREEGQCGVFV